MEVEVACPGLSVLKSLMVSVDVKHHLTMLTHWSQFIPNMSTDIRGHKALLHHQEEKMIRVQELCESRGGRPGLSVLMSLAVSEDVKQH